MEITITKTDFERALPVGTSAHDEVYDSIAPAIDEKLDFMRTVLLGYAGEKRLEELGDDSSLMTQLKKLVSLSAFLSVFRQLDLVLTSTGFGIVSNQNLSPASQMRVDALEEQLKTEYDKTLGRVLDGLRSENWGATEQARYFIRHLYGEYAFFFGQRRGESDKEWKGYQATVEAVDDMVRAAISDAQMNDILDAYRRADSNRLAPYEGVIAQVIRITDIFSSRGYEDRKTPAWHRLMQTVDAEENATAFRLYRESSNYKANHHEKFRNTKQSAGFFFGG